MSGFGTAILESAYMNFKSICTTHNTFDKKFKISNMWENKKEPIVEQKLSNIKFNDELTFKEFKDNVIVYGKLSKFPKLDN